MLGNLGLDQLFAVRPERIEGAHLVLTHEAAVANNVSDQNSGETALHGFLPEKGE